MIRVLNLLKKISHTIYFDYFCMVLFGCMVACGLPPIGLHFFSMAGLILTFHKIHKIGSKRTVVFYMIFVFLGYFLLSSFWLMAPFLSSDKFVAKLMLPVGVIGFLFASTIYSLPFFFLPLFKKNINKLFAFASLFAISEWIRSFVFVGFGYNMLGTMWYNNLTLSQSASIFGVYGLTFLTVLFFTSPYLLFSERKSLKSLLLPALFLFSFVVLLYCWGMSRLYFADESFTSNKKIRIVQPSINTIYDYIPSIIYRNTEDIKSLVKTKNINDVLAVFLHETAFRSYISNQDKYVMQNAIGDIIPKNGYLISGMPRIEYSWNTDNTVFGKQFFNSVVAINSDFDVSGKYFKKRLVPFGEYIPRVFKFFLPKVLTSSSGFNFPNSEDDKLIKLNGLPALSFSLCNEDGHAGQLIKLDLKKDAEAIVNAANISWFGKNNIAAIQNYAYAVMRSIEEGLPNIRVINRGISGIISPYGKLVTGNVVIVNKDDYQTILFDGKMDKIMPDEAGIIDVQIPNKIHRTFYNITGNYFTISFLLISLIVVYFFDKKKKLIAPKINKNFLLDFKFLKTRIFLFNILSVAFGSLFVLSAPPFNIFFIAIISIVGLYILFEKNRNNLFNLIFVLFLFFYTYFFLGSGWLTGPMRLPGVENAFNRYADIFQIIIPFFVFIFSSIAFIPVAKIKNNALRFLGFACAFAFGEWLRSRSYILTGFPFLYLGAIWIQVKPILQFLSLFGIYGLSFVTVLCFSSITTIFLKYKHRFIYVASSAIILLLIFIWGNYRMVKNRYVPNLNLRLVQPLKDRHLDRNDLEEYEKNFNLVLNVANQNLNKDINLLIFSEAAVPYNMASDSIDSIRYERLVSRLKSVIPKDGYLITGFIGNYVTGNIFERKKMTSKQYNMIGLFDNKLNMLTSYKKVHLVPLGEYVPNYLSTLFPRKITAGSTDLYPGSTRNIMYNLLSKKIPPFVGNLCYEEVYSSNITDKNLIKDNNFDWILNLTDDVWFRNTSYPYHHFISSILRAVEEGKTYVRVANDGPTAVIDRYGRLIKGTASIMKLDDNKVSVVKQMNAEMLDYSQMGTLDIKLPISKEKSTLYSKTGDYLIRNIFIFSLVFLTVLDFIISKQYKLYLFLFKKIKIGFHSFIMYFNLNLKR